MAFGNPTAAQTAAINAAPAAKQGDVRVNRGQDGYIFASGILDPEHSSYLSFEFPQYYATAILDRVGSYESTTQDVFSWSEMDRTRTSAEITAGGGATGASITLTTDIEAVTGSDGYFIIGDQLQTEKNKTIKVISVAVTGGSPSYQTITVTKGDGTAFVAGDTTDTERLGHLSSAFGEYSDAPKGRVYLPDEKWNALQTIRRSCHISGKSLTNRTYFKDGVSWAYYQEMIEAKEMAKDRENAVILGELSAVGTDDQTCAGINTSILAGGVTGSYTGAVTEDDIQNQITALRISSHANEYIVFAGAQYMADAHKALQPYYVNGGVDYGMFSGVDMVGISLNAYSFFDITVYFVHYPTFDDRETLPFDGTPDATKVNYGNYSLWLNLGGTGGERNIDLMYKELDGMQRKFILKKEDGLMGDGAKVANGKDGNSTHMLSEIAPRVRNLNQHGTHRAIG